MPKHDPATSEPSLPGFIDWLKSKDPNEHYEWPNSTICACGQFAASFGAQKDWLTRAGQGTWGKLNTLAAGEPGPDGSRQSVSWTFGKCLKRAERALENV